jgi:hypothetical protein
MLTAFCALDCVISKSKHSSPKVQGPSKLPPVFATFATGIAFVKASQWWPTLMGADFCWYLDSARNAILEASELSGQRVVIVGFSAGGWLARLLLAPTPYCGAPSRCSLYSWLLLCLWCRRCLTYRDQPHDFRSKLGRGGTCEQLDYPRITASIEGGLSIWTDCGSEVWRT